jgi:hypothetical protein
MPARTLLITSPLLAGPDVVAVQRRLVALGYDPGQVDGEYGLVTAAAVTAFQRAVGITVDGIVGAETREALAAAGRPDPPGPPGPGGSATGRKALAEARKLIGTKEDPPGSNRTLFGAWFGENGVPWCNIFISYCFAIGAGYTIAGGFGGTGCTEHGCSFVPTTEAWLRSAGMWLGRVEPRPGDLAIYNWGGGEPDHIGIVDRSTGKGMFTAIEGNTAIGDDSNGGEVMRRERRLAQVEGFGRITR